MQMEQAVAPWGVIEHLLQFKMEQFPEQVPSLVKV